MKKSKREVKESAIETEEKYVAFLKKRLESKNFLNNSTEREIEETKAKYEKAKLKLKFLKT